MAKEKIRKTLEELKASIEPEMNPDHLNDWHPCTHGYHFKVLRDRLGDESAFYGFNLQAAITAPSSIKFRQRDSDFHPNGKRGDYLFVDKSGGRLVVPFQLFKLIFA